MVGIVLVLERNSRSLVVPNIQGGGGNLQSSLSQNDANLIPVALNKALM